MGQRYRFDARLADAACALIERQRLTSGRFAGQPFRLQPWQRDRVVRPLFGVLREDGTRRYRQLYLEVPRKNGKSETVASIANTAMLADGEVGAEGYCCGVDKAQASIVFDRASRMLEMAPDLRRAVELFKGSIFIPRLHAKMVPLSGTPKGKHGLNAHVAVYDEVHEYATDDLVDVVHKSTAARRQPLELAATTAGVCGWGYGWKLHQYARAVADGKIEDDELLVVIFAADPNDDWRDPRVWGAANPNLGVTVNQDFLAAEMRKAQTPTQQSDFKRFHLNVWADAIQKWLLGEDWKACAGAVPWHDFRDTLRGQRCWGGLDLSTTTDLTSLCWDFPGGGADGGDAAVWRFWLPEKALRRRMESKDGTDYHAMVETGALTVIPGDVLDYDMIRRQIIEDFAWYDVQALGIDRWNATQLAVQLQEDGAPVFRIGQGFGSMSSPSKELERRVVAGTARHGGHPVATWQAGHVCVARDPAGNIKPDKAKTTDSIDGIVAWIIAIAMREAQPEQRPSVYEQRGLDAA